MLMIETIPYIYFKNVKENDDQIFHADIEGIRILGIADGVSNCSKGRVASATLCFALSKYFHEHPILDDLTVYAGHAIEDAIEELYDVQELFNEHYDNLFVTPQLVDEKAAETDLKREKDNYGIEDQEVVNKIRDEVSMTLPTSVNTKEKRKLIKGKKNDYNNTILNEIDSELEFTTNQEMVVEEKPSVFNELETKLQEIFVYLKRFNGEEYENVDDFVKSILIKVRRTDSGCFNFQTTLSLNILKSGEEYVELNSFNYGDSELLIISINPITVSIDSQISHYRLHQGDLKSFISSSNGKNGRLDISMRKLYENDLLLVGSDGTFFSKTAKASGNPFSPLHNLIIGCLRSNVISQLPHLWFEKLRSMNALDDDFSMFLIECAKSLGTETEIKP